MNTSVTSRLARVGSKAVVLVGLATILDLVAGVTTFALTGTSLGPVPGSAATKPLQTAYARINASSATLVTAKRGVAKVQKVQTDDGGTPSNPGDDSWVYCFDLAFAPKVAVGSPFIANNAVIATTTKEPNNTGFAGCPNDIVWDAAVRTYAANDPHSARRGDISFEIVFHG